MRRVLTFVTTLALCLAFAAPAFAQESTVHIVRRGENLYRISLR